MMYAHEVGDMVRVKGSEHPLTVTDRYWLRDEPWYGVKTVGGYVSVSLRESQVEAYDASA